VRKDSSTEGAKKKLFADKVMQKNSGGDATNIGDEFLSKESGRIGAHMQGYCPLAFYHGLSTT
jgi:hypothetical protein